MTALFRVAFWIAVVAILYGTAAALFGIFTVLRNRAEWYQSQRERLLERRRGVDQELSRRRHE